MITFTKGNLLDSKAEALVNTVNTVGVMGKGIALQFKENFPNNYKIYRDACKNKTFQTGQVLVVNEGNLLDKKFIINFPTKAHWKGKSKYEYIETGLVALKRALEEYDIKSVAIPPLGCGNGGLDWSIVRKMIEDAFKNTEVDIIIYEPNQQIKAILQKKNTKKKAELTSARAMLLYSLFMFEAQGEQSSLFVANKLAYFLQRGGESLKLKFQPHHYGPYSVQLNHVLYYLNGTYLTGLEQNKTKAFEPIKLNYDKWDEVKTYVNNKISSTQRERLENLQKLISGFQSTFSLELLATVDYLISQDKNKSVDDLMIDINKWSERKTQIFKPEYVQIAYNHLRDYSENPFS